MVVWSCKYLSIFIYVSDLLFVNDLYNKCNACVFFYLLSIEIIQNIKNGMNIILYVFKGRYYGFTF